MHSGYVTVACRVRIGEELTYKSTGAVPLGICIHMTLPLA